MKKKLSLLQIPQSSTSLSLAAAVAFTAGWGLLWFHTRSLWKTLVPAGSLPGFPWEEAGLTAGRLGLVFCLLLAGYVLGYLVLARSGGSGPDRRALLWLTLACGVGFLFAFLMFPAGSPDAFHYLAEAKRFVLHHPNPYLATPSEVLADPVVRSFDFLPNAPLGYGPIWLYLVTLPGLVTGHDSVVNALFGLKVLHGLLLIVTACLIALTAEKGPARRVRFYLFLANPLVLFEGLGNIHNDVMQAFFIVLSLSLLGRRLFAAAGSFAAGCLVKFFPVFLVPVMLFEGRVRKWNLRQWGMVLLGAFSVTGLSVLPFWANGRGMKGLMQGVLEATHPFSSASLVSLAREIFAPVPSTGSGLQVTLLFGALFLLFPVLAFFMRSRGTSLEGCLALAYMCFLLCVSLHYPWYFIPGLALLLLSGTAAADRLFLLIFTAGGLLYYPLSLALAPLPGMTPVALHVGQAALITLPVLVWMLITVTLELAAER